MADDVAHTPATEEAGDDEHVEHEEADVHFEPIIKLEAVEVPTLEENEEALFTKRARIYRYDAKPREWKERGTGELKLLKHKESGLVRLLMRRDKTLKICANHYISPLMDLQPHQGSNKTWVYTCPADFAEGEVTAEVFAIRFGDAEKASEFKTAFDEAKASNVKITGDKVPEKKGDESESEGSASETESEEESGSDGEETKEVTEQLTKLNVKEGEDKKDSA